MAPQQFFQLGASGSAAAANHSTWHVVGVTLVT